MNYPARISSESVDKYTLFKHYFNLGKNRNLENLLDKTTLELKDLKILSQKYNWDNRINKFQHNEPQVELKQNLENLKHKTKDLDILKKLEENLNKCIEKLNEMSNPEDLFDKDDDNFTKISKIEKIMKLINLFLSISDKIEKRINKITGVDI